MSYNPYAHTTATTAHVGLLKLSTGVSADGSGGLVTTSVPNGVTTGGSYSDPSWITSLSGSKLSGTVVATNGVVTSGSYSDPSWLTISKTKVGLSAVENTALSTWAGSSNITTVGSLGSTQISSLGIGTAASGTTGEIRATNNITGYYTSDRTLKENIRNIDNALNKVKSVNGVYFDWIQSYIDSRGGEDGYFVRRSDTGVIAQEIESVLPEVVGTREDGTKAVAYEKLAGLLIEAIKELDLKIEEIKTHLGI
jgi:hypothetical protein